MTTAPLRRLSTAPSDSHDPDAVLLAAIDGGDNRRALTELDRQHGDSLYRYIRHMMGSDDLADDVFQTTMVQAYRDLHTFTRQSSVRAWAFGIARHRCLDALKAQRRHTRRFVSTEKCPDRADAAPGVDQRLDDRELAAALERCVQQLAPHVRMAVLMRFQENMTYDEIAAICHEQAATLRARVSRALPVLRRCVEAQGIL